MKKLFALLMALTMTVQLVTPAWADAVEDGPEKSTEAVEVVEETTEATEETEVPEETEAETEETEATEEVTEPESEAGEEAAAKVRVRFACTPEDLTLVVFPADGDVDQAIDAEEDGSYLLTAGEYGYLAEAEGYESTQGSFTVDKMDTDCTFNVTLAESPSSEYRVLELPQIEFPRTNHGICVGDGWTFQQCYERTNGSSNWRDHSQLYGASRPACLVVCHECQRDGLGIPQYKRGKWSLLSLWACAYYHVGSCKGAYYNRAG